MADSPKSNNDNVKASILHPPIMKIDGPVEEKDELESDNSEIKSCSPKEDFKMCTPTFRPPSLNTNNHLASSRLSRGILKPPQLSLNPPTAPKPFVLKPSQLNPLASKSDTCDSNSEKTDNSNKQSNQVNGDTPKFVPLVSDTKPPTVTTTSFPATQSSTSTTTVASSSFVFGENLRDRVLAVDSDESKPSSSLSTNGTTGMLFSAAIKNEAKPDSAPKDKEKETKSLSESAREYEELRANKRKYEEVEVVTGEENEKNILNMSCKLFAFDKAGGNWQERGRGTLRLNDFENDGQVGSRLVFRTSGSLRVVLNTKIWAEMTVDKASEKSIRLTALDAQGEVKVFLIMTNIEDSNRLYNHLMHRLEREIAAQKRKKAESITEADVN